jgi:heat-inducible transcriptional repressor
MMGRHDRILHLVADDYVRTAKPVSSAAIAARLDVSSATVRSAFGALEESGLLQQPHTSAGRVPTALGFRRYALDLWPPEPLPPQVVHDLRGRFAVLAGDALVHELARVVAALTGYAVVVTLPTGADLHALEIHLSAYQAGALLAVVVLENGHVRQLRVEIDPSPDDDVLDDAERQLRQLTVPLSDVPAALTSIALGAESELARTLCAIARAWPTLHAPRTIGAGLVGVLEEPEAHDASFVRLLVERLERPQAGESVGEVLRHEAVSLRWDDALALVERDWPTGHPTGRLTVIGPKRLRYGRALQVLDGVPRFTASTAIP